MTQETTYDKRVRQNLNAIKQTSQSLLDQTTNEAFANTYAQLQKLKSTQKRLKVMTPEQRTLMNAGLADDYDDLRKQRAKSNEQEKKEVAAAVEAISKAKMPRP